MFGTLNKSKLLLAAALVAAFISGCGEPTEPPLTTDKLGTEQKRGDDEKRPAGGPARPAPNANAPYSPRR